MTKDNFFDHLYYRTNKRLLSIIGIWPEQSSFMRCLMPFLVWAILVTITIPEVIRFRMVRNDFDTLMECIPPFMVMGLGVTQLSNGSLNRQKIQEMLNRISSDWKRLGQSPNIEIIHKYAAQGHFITVAYSNFMCFACMFYLITPVMPVILDVIVPLNESRKRNFLYEAEYGPNADDYYWLILAHSYIASIVSVFLIVSCDVLFFAMVEHACGLFEIVGVNLSMLKNTITDDGSAKKDDYKMICHCVHLHKEAIVFADLIEASFSTSFIAVIGFCVILLTLTGVQTIMHLDQPEITLRFGSFSIAQVVHLYFNSVPGQKLVDYSSSIFEYAYAENWDGLSVRAQKVLIIIMIRSLKPCQITAGKVYVVTMERYSRVMQTCMSYFTVLSSMR